MSECCSTLWNNISSENVEPRPDHVKSFPQVKSAAAANGGAAVADLG
jgi:hypothetical protein